jgi:hypothetical protein
MLEIKVKFEKGCYDILCKNFTFKITSRRLRDTYVTGCTMHLLISLQ